jgi:anaerobic ribonucleoside-triphosphate reductase activating protein
MRYNTIKKNDIANCPGVAVSVYLQGCPHHCYKCFNQETWDFNGGKEFTDETLNDIITGLTENGVKRSLCLLGGEPLCPENQPLTYLIISSVKEKLPDTKIYIWTGYYLDQLLKSKSQLLDQILELTDCVVDGPYIDALRDIRLPMRGSSNQNINYLKKEKR